MESHGLSVFTILPAQGKPTKCASLVAQPKEDIKEAIDVIALYLIVLK